MLLPTKESTTPCIKTLWEEEEKALFHNLKRKKHKELKKKLELSLHVTVILKEKKFILNFQIWSNAPMIWLI